MNHDDEVVLNDYEIDLDFNRYVIINGYMIQQVTSHFSATLDFPEEENVKRRLQYLDIVLVYTDEDDSEKEIELNQHIIKSIKGKFNDLWV